MSTDISFGASFAEDFPYQMLFCTERWRLHWKDDRRLVVEGVLETDGLLIPLERAENVLNVKEDATERMRSPDTGVTNAIVRLERGGAEAGITD
mmetsp:Transcript_165/g.347  ORF Transcript_165/g.347 Transcript_165/m.347 type:complete len:94 (-) Transcript_165:27-308(-)